MDRGEEAGVEEEETEAEEGWGVVTMAKCLP